LGHLPTVITGSVSESCWAEPHSTTC